MPEFKALGRPITGPSRNLETFPKPDYITEIKFTSNELTSFCPVTGQPDFSTVEILYHPDKLCIESKSLKLYLWSFREERIFGEGLASRMAQDIQQATGAGYCRVTITQNIRGGLQLQAVAEIGEQS
jgi:7-cyano-7-deazaguanine reductase